MTQLICTALLYLVVVAFARALPWPTPWYQRKPLSCDACMVMWCAILDTLYSWETHSHGWSFFGIFLGETGPAAGLAFLLIALYGYWKGPSLPPLGS